MYAMKLLNINLPTLIVALLIAALVVAIVVNEIRKKKQGIGSCSCGGNCGACGGCCGSERPSDEQNPQ
jgi:hypothetical protein